MGWIMRVLKMMLSGAARSYRYSLRSALSRFITREEFIALNTEYPNIEGLFDACTKKLQVDESRLLAACATIMHLEVVKRIPPLNINLLPVGFTLHVCKERLICPIIEADVLTGYAVADPVVMKSLVKEFDLPILVAMLSSPKQILAALNDAEHSNDKKRAEEQTIDSSKAESILREITHQVSVKGADEIVVFEDSPGKLCYEASCAGRLVGKGKISPSMKGCLGLWFKHHASDKVSFDFDSSVITIDIALGFGNHLGILKLQSEEQGISSLSVAQTQSASVRSSKRNTAGITIDSLVEENELPRVLVVEDNPTLSRVLDRLLVAHGYQVTLAPHGGVALEMLEHSGVFEAVVCDIHMQKVDGLHFIQTIRSRQVQLPIIMLTSDVDPTIELRVLELGADVFLTKDVDPELLLAHLKRRIGAMRSIMSSLRGPTAVAIGVIAGDERHDC